MGCGSEETVDGTGAAGAAGSGGSSDGGAGTQTVTSTSQTTTASSGGATSCGGLVEPFECDPPAAPGSFYATAAESSDIALFDPISMCQLRGDVLLIVNTAEF